ncbi:MAG: CDP-archaeol synthase [Oscillospiraceae bacterium]|nr:CDP-archaeol synthase [Oscillospiraceae bacterium]
MLQRILVAVIGVPVLILALTVAPIWGALVLLAALCILAAHELMSAVCPPEIARRWWGRAAAAAVFVLVGVFFQTPDFAATPLSAVMPFFAAAPVILIFAAAVMRYGKEDALSLQDLCAMLISGCAIPLAFGCLLQLRAMEYGAGLVLIPLVAAFCSDTMALFGGMALGRHKLIPRVSPKKTVEGALSGLVGGMVGMILYRIVFFLVTEVALNVAWCVLLGLVGALMGQLGDLVFSFVKRQFGIKDYGRLLPGHGGVLDRFDSVIFAAPLIWMIVRCIRLY